MAYKEVKIEFKEEFEDGDKFSFKYDGHEVKGEFADRRTRKHQISTVETEDSDLPEGTATRDAIMDFINDRFIMKGRDEFVGLDVGGAIDEYARLWLVSDDKSKGFSDLDFPDDKSEVEGRGTTQANFDIEEVEYKSADDCDLVEVEIKANKNIHDIESSKSISYDDSDFGHKEFSFKIDRGKSTTIKGIDGEGDESNSVIIKGIPKLRSSQFSSNINYTVEGSNVTINSDEDVQGVIDEDILELEYKLEDEDWQDSKSFNGVAEGEYEIKVRDNFGCEVSFDIDVDESAVNEPYTHVSKSNSIHFVENIDTDLCNVLSNETNTLSCDEDVETVFKEIQQLQSCDIITTQFKSNFRNLSAKVNILGKDEENSVSVDKKTENIGRRDKREAFHKIYDEKDVGIYFTKGEKYDFNDENEVLDTYKLNGSLPEWGEKYNLLQYEDEWYEIDDIAFDEDENAQVLIIEDHAGDFPEDEGDAITVGSIYNRDNFEVYEFTIDMEDYEGEYIDVEIINEDPNWEPVKYISEQIRVKEKWKNAKLIEYYNRYNTDINYATGIKNYLRVKVEEKEGGLESENEIHKTDSGATLLDDQVYETDNFTFELVTTNIMRKLSVAFAHSNLKINGQPYVKSEEPDIEIMEGSNLYRVSVILIKTDDAFSPGHFESGDSGVEVPRLVGEDDEFVKV